MTRVDFPPTGPRLAAAVLVWLALAAPLLACEWNGGEAEAEVQSAVSVELATVSAAPLRDVATFSGQLSAEHSVMVKADADGIIEELLFEEGQPVEAGKILFRLRDREQLARLREAEANLGLAREVFARTQGLHRRNAISQAARDEAAAELAVAEARVDVAKVELERTRVRAPFDGVVGARLVSPGDRVDEDVPLVQIDALDRLQVLYSISELGILFTRVGTPVEVRVAPYPGEVFPGEVFFVSPTLDPDTRRILAKAWVPNADGRLRAGLFATVDMLVQEKPNAILVPEAAVVFDRRGSYVWRVDDSMVASRVPVETGLRRDGEVEITLGLRPGDRIVTAGVHKVEEGEPVVAVSGVPESSGQALGKAPAPAGDGA